MAFLEVKNLSRVYGKGEAAVRALDNVSFEVPKGQFVAVMGASGSGKSTLMHLLGGVDRPTAGVVTLDGVSLHFCWMEERRTPRACQTCWCGWDFRKNEKHSLHNSQVDSSSGWLLATRCSRDQRCFWRMSLLEILIRQRAKVLQNC